MLNQIKKEAKKLINLPLSKVEAKISEARKMKGNTFADNLVNCLIKMASRFNAEVYYGK